MRQTFLLILFIIVLPVSCVNYAQQGKFATDTSEIQLRRPSENSMKQFRMDKEFRYSRIETPVGFWEIVSAWIRELLRYIAKSKSFLFITRYFNYLILLIAIVLVAFILYKSKLQGIFYKDEKTQFNFKELSNNIHEIDFEKLINEAISNKEYRVAVRYHYLRTLKLLSDCGLIEWEINKTNNQYVKEIREKGLNQLFSELTNIFEWIWYGDLIIENSLFEAVQGKFTSFNNRLTVNK